MRRSNTPPNFEKLLEDRRRLTKKRWIEGLSREEEGEYEEINLKIKQALTDIQSIKPMK